MEFQVRIHVMHIHQNPLFVFLAALGLRLYSDHRYDCTIRVAGWGPVTIATMRDAGKRIRRTKTWRQPLPGGRPRLRDELRSTRWTRGPAPQRGQYSYGHTKSVAAAHGSRISDDAGADLRTASGPV